MTHTNTPQKRSLFSERLRILIEETGKTQAAVADDISKSNSEVKISRQALNSYLQSDASPDIQRFKAISDYFDVSYDYMLGVTNNRRRENANIAEKTGLSDSSLALLESYMADDSEKKRHRYMKAINSILSSKTATDAFIEFMNIENGRQKCASISKTTDTGTETFDLPSAIYASIWLTNIQTILENIRTRKDIDHTALILPAIKENRVPPSLQTDMEEIREGVFHAKHPKD